MDLHRRRIVYLTDADWLAVTSRAKAAGVTASALIRSALFHIPEGAPARPARAPKPSATTTMFTAEHPEHGIAVKVGDEDWKPMAAKLDLTDGSKVDLPKLGSFGQSRAVPKPSSKPKPSRRF